MLRTLTQKVVLAAGVFMVIVGIAAAVAVPNTITIREATDHLTTHTLEQFHLNGHFVANTQRSVVESLAFVRTRNNRERDEAQAALAEAKANLAALGSVETEHHHDAADTDEDHAAEATGSEQDQFDLALNPQYLELQQQRTAFFTNIEQRVNELLGAVAANDNVVIDRAIAALDTLEDQGELLSETADQLNQQNAVAANQAVDTRVIRAISIEMSAFLCFALLVVGAVVGLRTLIVKPLKQLSQATAVIASGDLHQSIAVTSDDEIGELQRAFNQMVDHLREQRMVIENRNEQLEQNLDAQQKLLARVQQLSTPLLPVWDGVVVLPLVGHVDTQRADEIMQTLLRGVTHQRAHTAILDVTGVAVLDTHVVKLLLQAVQATELLGAKVLLAGITAVMAQVVVTQGVNLGNLRTHRDLRSAVESALGGGIPLTTQV